MKLLKHFIIWLILLPFVGGLFIGANELIRIDVRSGQVRSESLPLDFPSYPQLMIPDLRMPDIRDMQIEAKVIPQYQFLSRFAQEELETLRNEE